MSQSNLSLTLRFEQVPRLRKVDKLAEQEGKRSNSHEASDVLKVIEVTRNLYMI